MFVRPAEPTDEKLLWAMLYEASYARENGIDSPDHLRGTPKLAHYVEGWGAAGDLGVVGGFDGVPLGAAWLRLFGPDDPAYGYVDADTPELAIGVAPEGRGTGLGTALMSALHDTAREKYDAISLSVRLENPARRLYQRLGYVDVPGSGQVNLAGTASVTMVLRLR
ncbi:GNAT family N-acetyltransferase [Nocardia yunnanensis]|uniref:GNAT family N-acetyltransferase n=1 Tax=Nocardia yunnanensis TaxID=2382165 RepID=A0A386ZCS1_9NOCA|nr:GNAT family N-acetyltransferase [Nocardia yunnanensis]AYF75137.1 GNAT family N-acetyltransferase [Nocardia yunnanensis]